MEKTVITTDSGSNPRNIDLMIPCVIIDHNEKNYYDTQKVSKNENDKIEAIDSLEVLDRAVNGERFHTSAPNIDDYITVMTPLLEEGKNIVHISMSSGISAGSVNASNVAAGILNDEYGDNRVTVIDSLTGGCGGTVINDYANDLLNKGLTSKEIVKRLEELRKKIFATFFISKVEGFVSSGRAPKLAVLSDKLSFRFRIDINDKGKLFPHLPVYRGNIKTQFLKYLKNIINEDNMHEFDPNYLSILVTRLKEIDIEEAKEYLKKLNYFNKEIIEEIKFSSVITSYGVEDQVGIGLIKK